MKFSFINSQCLHSPGLCSGSLKDGKVLMKMGLALVLVGHVNFLLGALVHGAVLRHIHVQNRIGTLLYAISNVIAIVAGLMVSEIIVKLQTIISNILN